MTNVHEALKVAILHIEANFNLTGDDKYLSDLNLCKSALAELDAYVESEIERRFKFPVMLRKMWSGSEVQDWINEAKKG